MVAKLTNAGGGEWGDGFDWVMVEGEQRVLKDDSLMRKADL